MNGIDVALIILLMAVTGFAVKTSIRNARKDNSCMGNCTHCNGCVAKGREELADAGSYDYSGSRTADRVGNMEKYQ